MRYRKTQEDYIQQVAMKHSGFYSYENTVYVKSTKKIIVTCPVHDDFEIVAAEHTRGKGCAKCWFERVGKAKRNTHESFLLKAKARHGDKYDYSQTVFKSNNKHINVICKVHDVFSISAKEHLRGRGCGKCGYDQANESKRLTQDEFLERALAVHGNRYDYSETKYKGFNKKITVRCYDHGPFSQQAGNHLWGNDCPSCSSHGFDPNKPATLYILRAGETTKIGITNRTVVERLASLNRKRPEKFTVVQEFYHTNGGMISDVETTLLRKLRRMYEQPPEKYEGFSECFSNVSLELLISTIRELIQEHLDAQTLEVNFTTLP